LLNQDETTPKAKSLNAQETSSAVAQLGAILRFFEAETDTEVEALHADL
jgi:hypothetical protein